MIISRTTHVVATGIISFFVMSEEYSCVCVCVCTHTSSLSIHLLVNIGVNVFFEIILLSEFMPKSGIAGLYGNSILFFEELLYCFP